MSLNEDRDSGKPGKPYAQKAENDAVAKPAAAHRSMQDAWKLIDTLLAGTAAMRAAGRDYLKQHPYETNDAYADRLDATVLKNYTLATLNTLVGKAFAEPPAPAEDVPDEILKLLEDVDDEGTALVPFARSWFRSGVRHGVAHVLVDRTAVHDRADGTPRTKADDERDGVRPVWRLLQGPDVLDVKDYKVGSRRIVSLVRFRDDVMVEDGLFGERLVERIKVIRPGLWELWEKRKAAGGKVRWEPVDGGPYGLDEVPLVTFYTAKRGLAEADQPLEPLAHVNVEHWQSSSDQRNILTVVRFPMLAVSGVQSSENQAGAGEIVVGPRKLLTTSDPQAKVYFVEHTGAAVDSGFKDLEQLEAEMASHGAEFLKKKVGGPESASGRVLDAGEAISPLKAWGSDFKDCLEQCMELTGRWLNMAEGEAGSIEFEVEEDVDLTNPDELNWLTAARAKGDISRESSLGEAKRRRVLPDDFDIDKDKEQLDAEPPPEGGLGGMYKAPAAKPAAKAPPTK